MTKTMQKVHVQKQSDFDWQDQSDINTLLLLAKMCCVCWGISLRTIEDPNQLAPIRRESHCGLSTHFLSHFPLDTMKKTRFSHCTKMVLVMSHNDFSRLFVQNGVV